MTQTQPQRPLLRIGSIEFLASVIIAIVSTAIHPSKEDPANHPLVFAEYASDDSWIVVHIGQFAGGIMVFAGGFQGNSLSLAQFDSGIMQTGQTFRYTFNPGTFEYYCTMHPSMVGEIVVS